MKLTAATFNMQNGLPWSDADPDGTRPDLDATIAFLRELDADVLFLQEVEEGHDGGEQIEPPPNFSILRGALAGTDTFFSYPPKNPDELPFGLGLAIFSRFPLQATKVHVLPAGRVGFEFGGRRRQLSERMLIEAETMVAGREVRLMNTHLQAFFMIGASSEEHRCQRDAVERLLHNSKAPTLLGGDFNSAPGEDLVGQFAAAGFRSAQTTTPTWKRMPYVVDHLFYGGGWRLVACDVIPTACSDHHALRTVFELDA